MAWPEVVVIGAASVDIKGKTLRPLVRATSNPGRIKLTAGGAARNIAENLARLGMSTALLTAVGDDPYGRAVLDRTSAAGVDVSRAVIAPEKPTSSYLAVISQDGQMIVSIDDMGAIGTLSPTYLHDHREVFRHARMVVMDANTPARTMTTVFAIVTRYRIPICVNPVSVALAPKVKPRLSHCTIITPNAAEAEALTGMPVTNSQEAVRAAQRLLAEGVDIAIITRGKEGLSYAYGDGSGNIPSIRMEVVDGTGSSDALTAAAVYGLMNGFTVDEAVRLGVSAAAITVASAETVSPDLSLDYLYQTLSL